MRRWIFFSLLLLLLLHAGGAQYDSARVNARPRWQDRFTSADRYFDLHSRRPEAPVVSSVPRFTLLAPALLRTDSQENIYLQADDLSIPITASIVIQDFDKSVFLLQDSVDLNLENRYQALKTIQLSSILLNRNEKKNKFVYLTVNFGSFHSEERVLMVTFQSGYIFIQTDKPIYNPGDTVQFRAFVSSPFFKAFTSNININIENPDGVVVWQIYRSRAEDGIFENSFPLSEFVNEGRWKLTARFDHWKQNTFSSHFEVKKYVLPAFNVTLTPRTSFLSLEDSGLEVEVLARYLFGETVQGTAYVVFGVKIDQEQIRLPSVKQVSDLESGVVTLSMDEIKAAYPDIRSLVGKTIYVKASVLTQTGSDLVEAEKTGIKIVESPFVVSFRDMTKYFKPGLPFDFTVQVSHHDGSPASSVPVKINLLDTPRLVSGSASVTVNMLKHPFPQTIVAETAQAGLRPEQQARQDITVMPYISFDRRRPNFLYISTGINRVSVGDRMSFSLNIVTAEAEHRQLVKHVTYLVLSKGKIIQAKRMDVSGQLISNVGLTITTEMMPSFRFVAFYRIPWRRREEVVADSIWVDVANTCPGALKVGPSDGIPRDYFPGKSFKVKVRGDPGSKVGLAAVDNAVYLLNKDRLTQSKILDVVQKADIGCTQGGGENAKLVFSDAGLLFGSSGGLKTDVRQVLQCPGGARRRRSATLLQRKAQLVSHYKEKLLRRCCQDGLRDVPMPYSCTRRSFYITESWECIHAFRYCCATYKGEEFNTEMPTTTTTSAPTTTVRPSVSSRTFGGEGIMPYGRIPLRREMLDPGNVPQRIPKVMYTPANKGPETEGRTLHSADRVSADEVEEEEEEEEWEYEEESDVYVRSKFFETWLWTSVTLPNETERDGLASLTVNKALPDSITQWGILAISASPNTGFCVAEPYNVWAWKRFFVDLRLPYSVARNEQVEIKAVIHNYGYDDMHVRVVLMRTERMCSVAFKDRHTQEVTVPAGSSVAVPYTIVPLAVGMLPLEVMVLGRDLTGADGVKKELRVVMDGVQKTEVWSEVLDPLAKGGAQMIVFGKVELESVVPNSYPETFITVRGNMLADSIENSISDDPLARLIQMPGGCVEQNLATISLPLIAALYLERTSGWESVGVGKKAEALRYIKRGYENQLAYRKPDGSYPPYRGEGASTWITAYVVKVFSLAHSIIGVDKAQVCAPLLYLLKNKYDESRNSFREDNPVYSPTIMGGLRGDDQEKTLSAFVVIALAEAKLAGISCSDPSVDQHTILTNVASNLKRALKVHGRRPYTVAIISYALALVNTNYGPILSLRAPAGNHWPDRRNHLFTLEATGYALLALVRLNRIEEAKALFKWLNSQRRRGGAFGSTQSTMVVLHALSEYLIHQPPANDQSLNVDLRITGRTKIRYHFNPQTSYVARSSRLPNDLDLIVEAQGTGQGILEVVTHYHQLPEVDENKPCEHFELSVNISESATRPPADVVKSYQMTIKVRALGPRDVRMVVLDITLPTGFTPEKSDLMLLSNSVDRYINDFKVVDNLSDRGSLILHLFKVSHRQPEILVFRLQQNFKVGLLQPSAVKVYDYYSPDHSCSRTYSPRENQVELDHICRDNICRCTQGDCCITKSETENFSSEERETFACKSLHHVFRVQVLNVTQSYYDKYELEILQVIKLGEEAGVLARHRKLFLSHAGCRGGISLLPGAQYLLMGPRADLWTLDSNTSRFTYMLGKDTWVELWPSPAECAKTPSLQAKCQSLDATATELSVNGCRL
ncbi:complement C3-like isoform X2 [Nelusetta ayraudi]|uniref:complement C3-like isoform X2 n=1 Tax=Nelusetta ayraudi TaxID=303726 RepID=UPI003F721701